MTFIKYIKDLYEVFNKAGKLNEHKQILKLEEENERLKKENKEIQGKLKFQDDLEFKNNAYWKKSDGDGPYCSRCWDKNKKAIRINPKYNGSDDAICPECKNEFNFTGKGTGGAVLLSNDENFDRFKVF